jgi:hypothetical protein
MRIATMVNAVILSLPLAFAACGGHDHGAEAFQTLQACFDEHHTVEALSVNDAIVVCCVDHPIAGVNPSCKATVPECVTHVRAQLSPTTTMAEIQTACADYIAKK